MSAIETDVEVGPAVLTLLAEGHTIAGRNIENTVAGEAVHGQNLRQAGRVVKRSSRCGDSLPPIGSLDEADPIDPEASRPKATRRWTETGMNVALRPALALLAVLLPAGAAAQQGAPDLNRLVIDWATGRYASPVMCEIAGKPVRGVRRILITPETFRGQQSLAVIHFVDMQVDDASRCFNATGEGLPNVIGTLKIRLPGRPHPETALRDFKLAIRRERGFDFEIVGGSLSIRDVTSPPSAPRVVDFRGGHAGLHRALPATDEARELADFGSPRKAVLKIEARDRTRLSFPIFMTAPR